MEKAFLPLSPFKKKLKDVSLPQGHSSSKEDKENGEGEDFLVQELPSFFLSKKRESSLPSAAKKLIAFFSVEDRLPPVNEERIAMVNSPPPVTFYPE